jgi:hypothetical protein
VPSNYVKKEKKSLLEKIIPKMLQHQLSVNSLTNNNNNKDNYQIIKPNSNNSAISYSSKAVVKHKYTANK